MFLWYMITNERTQPLTRTKLHEIPPNRITRKCAIAKKLNHKISIYHRITRKCAIAKKISIYHRIIYTKYTITNGRFAAK